MSTRWADSRSRKHRDASYYTSGESGLRDPAAQLEPDNTCAQRAQHVRESLQELGPCYSSLALYLSSRIDLLPAEYCRELALTSLVVQPLSAQVVRRLFTEELGSFLDRSFDYIDYTPVDCTLITQSHQAKLRTGRLVTITVLRPEYYVLQSETGGTGFLSLDIVDEVFGGLPLE